MVAFNRKNQHGETCSNFFYFIFQFEHTMFCLFFFLLNINCFCFDGYRLGFVIDFLSKATLVGFMSGAAVIVSLQQLKGLLGISHFTSKMQFIPVMSSVFKHRDEASGIIKCKEAFVRIQNNNNNKMTRNIFRNLLTFNHFFNNSTIKVIGKRCQFFSKFFFSFCLSKFFYLKDCFNSY